MNNQSDKKSKYINLPSRKKLIEAKIPEELINKIKNGIDLSNEENNLLHSNGLELVYSKKRRSFVREYKGKTEKRMNNLKIANEERKINKNKKENDWHYLSDLYLYLSSKNEKQRKENGILDKTLLRMRSERYLYVKNGKYISSNKLKALMNPETIRKNWIHLTNHCRKKVLGKQQSPFINRILYLNGYPPIYYEKFNELYHNKEYGLIKALLLINNVHIVSNYFHNAITPNSNYETGIVKNINEEFIKILETNQSRNTIARWFLELKEFYGVKVPYNLFPVDGENKKKLRDFKPINEAVPTIDVRTIYVGDIKESCPIGLNEEECNKEWKFYDGVSEYAYRDFYLDVILVENNYPRKIHRTKKKVRIYLLRNSYGVALELKNYNSELMGVIFNINDIFELLDDDILQLIKENKEILKICTGKYSSIREYIEPNGLHIEYTCHFESIHNNRFYISLFIKKSNKIYSIIEYAEKNQSEFEINQLTESFSLEPDI